jgi:hypothetical protein
MNFGLGKVDVRGRSREEQAGMIKNRAVTRVFEKFHLGLYFSNFHSICTAEVRPIETDICVEAIQVHVYDPLFNEA